MASCSLEVSPGARCKHQPEIEPRVYTTRLPKSSVVLPLPQSQIPPSMSRCSTSGFSKEDSEPIYIPKSWDTQRDAVMMLADKQELERTTAQHVLGTSAQGDLGTSLPRPTSQSFSLRLARSETAAKPRTPSLVSGSSASTADSATSSLSRRKPSSVRRHGQSVQVGPMTSEHDMQTLRLLPDEHKDPFAGSVLGITLPEPATFRKTHEAGQGIMKCVELDTSQVTATRDMSPPTPLYTLSASPSTRHSDSPSSCSHASSPTSMSSNSLDITVAANPANPTLQETQVTSSINRPFVKDREIGERRALLDSQGLLYTREYSSSSSGSTVKAGGPGRQVTKPEMPRLPESHSSQSYHRPSVQASRIPKSDYTARRCQAPPVVSQQDVVQRPPELAHLADVPTKTVATRGRPARPSREGTEGSCEILRLRQASPVIQSNMSSLPDFSQRGQSSSDTPIGGFHGFPMTSRSRLVKPIKLPSRNPSPNLNLSSAISPVSPLLPVRRKHTPDMSSDTERLARRGASPAPSSPNKFASHFNFFTRRTKTKPVTPGAGADKRSRRGPTAGTGHEGYGRFGFRGRSASATNSSGSVDRSTSADSSVWSVSNIALSCNTSTASENTRTIDDSSLNKLDLAPSRDDGVFDYSSNQVTEGVRSPSSEVQIHCYDAYLDQPPCGEPVPHSTCIVNDHRLPKLSSSSRTESAQPASSGKRASIGQYATLDEETLNKSSLPTLGAHDLLCRSQCVQASTMIVPVPANIAVAAQPPYKRSGFSQDSVSGTEDVSSHTDKLVEGKAGHCFQATQVDIQPDYRTKLSRKWNFFQRARASSKGDTSVLGTRANTSDLPPSRFVAHYALNDSAGVVDVDDLEKILREADSDDQAVTELCSNMPQSTSPSRRECRDPLLLPPPPPVSTEHGRPREFALLGITSRNRQSLSPTSSDTDIDSRPASPVQHARVALGTPRIKTPMTILPQSRPRRLAQVGRIPGILPKEDQNRGLLDQSSSRPFASMQPPPKVPSSRSHSTAEFFSFSSRHDSDNACSSSSGTSGSPTTRTPMPLPSALASEDEVWREYDDLIDEVTKPQTRISAGTPSEIPSHHTNQIMDSAELNIKKNQLFQSREQSERSRTVANAESFLLSDLRPVSLHSVRSLSDLPALGTPSTPMSLTDLYTGYGERNLSVSDAVSSNSGIPPTRGVGTASTSLTSLSSTYPISSPHDADTQPLLHNSNISSMVESNECPQDTRSVEPAKDESYDLESMANLRLSALTTSKWLSFGRVLFSPVHFELKDKAADRVLILDGLGKGKHTYRSSSLRTLI